MKKDSIEYEEWCELFEYVKKDILGYDSNMNLPKFMILRLRGLHSGNFMSNKNIKPLANYSYKHILLTFKLNKNTIYSYLKRNEKIFKDEKHKFNGIMIIIESKINDIVNMIKKAEEQKEKTENIDVEYYNYDRVEYKKKDKKENKRLSDLW